MKKIFYEKVGRKYVPVSEYDNDLLDAFPKGSHLVCVYPGGSSRRYGIDPNYAAMIAAGRVAEDAISRSIMEATELRRNTQGDKGTPLTPEQKAAWEHLIEVFGPDARQLEWPSARECAEAGVKAMIDEADKLMQNPAVRRSYEQFMLICKLVSSETEHDNAS